MTTFGFEFEVYRGGYDVMRELHDRGAVANYDTLCPYHGCHEDYDPDTDRPIPGQCCDHADTQYLFSAQEDCTVSAEFPSRILRWGSKRAQDAFSIMEASVRAAGVSLDGDSGMHVHVAKPGRQRRASLRTHAGYFTKRERTTWRLHRMFARYQHDIAEIAAGHRSSVRDYNSPMEVSDSDAFWNTDLYGPLPVQRDSWSGYNSPVVSPENVYVHGSWLCTERHTATYEFRLWNAVPTAWQMRLCVGLSVAMTRAATHGVDVTRNDPRCIEEVLAPYLDAATWAGIMRQRYDKGGFVDTARPAVSPRQTWMVA